MSDDDRRSPKALAEAEYRAWKPRLEDLERAAEINREADRRRDQLLIQFDALNGPSAGLCLPPENAPAEIRNAVEQEWAKLSPESQTIVRQWHETNDWEFRELRAIERRRHAEQQSGLLPVGDAAIATLQALKLELVRLVSSIPTPAEYKNFFTTRFAPEYNKLSPFDRYCIECGTKFAVGDARAKGSEHCSPTCAARKRNRGRGRVSKADRIKDQFDKHIKNCRVCRSEKPCTRLELILAGEQALRARSRRLRSDE